MRQVEIKCKHISGSGWRARDRWGLINFLYVGLSFRTFNVWQSWYMKSSQHIFWNVDLLCAKSFILKEAICCFLPSLASLCSEIVRGSSSMGGVAGGSSSEGQDLGWRGVHHNTHGHLVLQPPTARLYSFSSLLQSIVLAFLDLGLPPLEHFQIRDFLVITIGLWKN